MVMQSIGSVMNFCMNKILTGLNPDSVAVFTVYFKLQSLFFMPVFGINNGMIPILAYNYGAGKRSRLIKTVKLSMMYAFASLLIGFTLFELEHEVKVIVKIVKNIIPKIKNRLAKFFFIV